MYIEVIRQSAHTVFKWLCCYGKPHFPQNIPFVRGKNHNRWEEKVSELKAIFHVHEEMGQRSQK